MVHATPVALTVALLQVWRVAGISRVEPRHVVWHGQQAAGSLTRCILWKSWPWLALPPSPSLPLSRSPTLSRSFSNDACNEMSLVLHSAMHLKWAAFLKGCPVAIAVISRLTESGWGNEGSGGSKEAAVAMSRNVAAENLNYLWLTECTSNIQTENTFKILLI